MRYITEHYGRPGRGFHAIQIEVNRALYLDEVSLELGRGFDSLRDAMEQFACRFASMLESILLPFPMAAE
jgi:N-formylglutamate deformylase